MARYLDQRLKLRHFRVVSAISAHASLLKAAGALRLTQPALTRSLQEIEEILGVKLYDRHPKGMRETPFGAALSASARAILAEVSRLDDTLDQLVHEHSATLTVGALPVAAEGILPAVIARLGDEEPGIQVRLVQGVTAELIPALSEGRIDLIVGRLYDSAPDGLKREALYQEPISLMARPDHPLFEGPGPTLERLGQCKLALPAVSTLLGQEIDQLLAAMNIDPSGPIRSSSLGFIREMMQSSDVVSIMPSMLMASDVLRGSIRMSPLPIAAPARPAGIIYRNGVALPPAATVLVQTLKAYVANVPHLAVA